MDETQFLLYITVLQVEYSQRYAETNPQAQSLRHLLSEAHILLRASLLKQNCDCEPTSSQTDREALEEAFRNNCAQLGDCFSR